MSLGLRNTGQVRKSICGRVIICVGIVLSAAAGAENAPQVKPVATATVTDPQEKNLGTLIGVQGLAAQVLIEARLQSECVGGWSVAYRAASCVRDLRLHRQALHFPAAQGFPGRGGNHGPSREVAIQPRSRRGFTVRYRSLLHQHAGCRSAILRFDSIAPTGRPAAGSRPGHAGSQAHRFEPVLYAALQYSDDPITDSVRGQPRAQEARIPDSASSKHSRFFKRR
jgi:hypothetical protein